MNLNNTSLVWVEVNKKVLANNVRTFRKITPKDTLLAPCVKANAFGHGLVETSRLFIEEGVDWLCVNSVEEAEKLRQARINVPILVIGYVQLSDLVKVFELDLRLFVYNLETAQELSRLSKEFNMMCNVHMKVDTGMSRQGVPISEAKYFFLTSLGLEGINIEGIATHFATADSEINNKHFQHQLDTFTKFVEDIQQTHKKKFIIHCSNSAATLLYPHASFNLVRPGISIYGYYPNEAVKNICERKNKRLNPAFSLKSKVAQVKVLAPNQGISYGSTYVTDKHTKVVLVPIGYYEGLRRSLSNSGYVKIGDQKAKILGRVCMHMTIVDGTDIGEVSLEDEVVAIGEDFIQELADKMETNVNEILVSIPSEIPRYFV